jgi:hypothetical protein
VTAKHPRTAHLNITLGPHAKANFTFLQGYLGGITQREVVERALAGFRMYVAVREAGKLVLTRDSDGVEEHIRMLGGESIEG